MKLIEKILSEENINEAIKRVKSNKGAPGVDKGAALKILGEMLGITTGVCQKLRADDGTSFGPTLREAVFYYCAIDAAAGIRPEPGFTCLTGLDYAALNNVADYAQKMRGDTA